ncbi:adenosylmethionine--8-amino-7-oxononanoate transaminase [Candidatus Igneacidithiobacillus taiwanensis]|uniref:adenosylmethionine--8-amino-7-oxononanoate transaminase n=1 Tax=Candidatus Igneacidithiobacillus taiwanensis TaxID=1945924 RepID=UPI00289D354E|nr:adenosylmethionine--8-amino-7-oxononanoate transaminase [Candidatus Igneacidithiobacillus taiwanensis]MCE5360858.1 adenosylmethionine--8-amino-7-oxononanoate transaminase [Acidithiobacillus sp.]
MSNEAELWEWDRAHFWHPFTQMACWGDDDPWIIERGEGNYVFDLRGRKALDAIASLWCNVHGHRHPRLDAALCQQLGRIAHSTVLGASHPPAIRLAKALSELAPPGLGRVFFSEDGAEAVEVAVKIAAQYWQNLGRPEKRLFLSLDDAYHGDTVGASSLGGFPLFHGVYGHLHFPVRRLPSPWLLQVAQGRDGARARELWLQALEQILAAQGQEIIALILEGGVQGAAGILPYPPGLLAGATELCRAYHVLLIVDEVATGFGRSGTLFYCEQEGVSPDLLALGKGISAGYLPLAATLAQEHIYQAFLAPFGEAKQFYYGHTYTANPLACAVALESLALFRENDLLAQVRARIEQLRVGLARFAALPYADAPRQFGLMAAVPLRNPKTGQAYAYGERREYAVCRRAREAGVYLRPLGDSLVIVPPLAVTANEIDLILQVLQQSMAEESAA